MCTENVEYRYKVGGSLQENDPSYVVRQADTDLYQALKRGNCCYVFNSRQMGKSSLRVRTRQKLEKEGVICAAIDLTAIGKDVTPQQWYAGVILQLANGFNLQINIPVWLQERSFFSPLQQLSQFIEEVLQEKLEQQIVIFVDEIDSIIGANFTDNFLGFIKSCHDNERSEFRRLTFVLMGVATPYDLRTDRSSTTFNIGTAIELDGFDLLRDNLEPLIGGLQEQNKVDNPQKVIEKILHWTGGQPFLTQKLCEKVFQSSELVQAGHEANCIDQLVQSHLIDSWESHDDPVHLRTIRDRLLYSKNSSVNLLNIYLQILQQREVKYQDENPEHMELRLSGLVVKKEGQLRVYNPIYQNVFHETWVKKELTKLDCLTTDLLPIYTPIYLEQQAEQKLYEELKAGKFCYVLSLPEMRQSKVMQPVQQRLKKEGIVCATLDLDKIDSRRSPEKFSGEQGEIWWYFSFCKNIVTSFQISINIQDWWEYNETLSPAERLDLFIEEVLLKQYHQDKKNIIFLDNFDSILRLKFATNSFFALLEDCYSKRSLKNKYNQLSFVLQGKASYPELIQNVSNPKTVIREVLNWTSGQPFLTEKLCELVCNAHAQDPIPDTEEVEWVENLVQKRVIENWEAQDKPRYLTVTRDDILNRERSKPGILKLYKRILQDEEVLADDSLEQIELMRSGLVVKQQDKLRIYNRIYECIFNQSWVEQELSKLVSVEEENGENLPENEINNPIKLVPETELENNTIQHLKPFIFLSIDEIRQTLTRCFNKTKQWVSRNCYRPYLLFLFLFFLTVILVIQVPQIIQKFQQQHQAQIKQEIERIAQEGKNAVEMFQSKELDGLIKAVRNGQDWKKLISNEPHLPLKDYPDPSPSYTLQIILHNIYEQNYLKEHKAPVRSVSFHPNKPLVATAGEDGTVKIWNQSGKVKYSQSTKQVNVRIVSFTPNGQFIATSGENGTVQFWKWNQKEQDKTLPLQLIGSPLQIDEGGEVKSMSFSPDSKIMVTAGGNQGLAKLWNIESLEKIEPLKPIDKLKSPDKKTIEIVIFSPDGQIIATAEQGGIVQLWSRSGQRTDIRFNTDQGGIESVKFSPDGQMIATIGRDSTIRLWDLQGKPKSQPLKTGGSNILSISFKPQEGNLIATAEESGIVKLYKLTTSEEDSTTKLRSLLSNLVAELNGHEKRVYDVSFSPDGNTLATVSLDQTVRFWKLSSLQELEKSFLKEQANIKSMGIAKAPDNRQRMAILKDNDTVQLWDLVSKKQIDLQGNLGKIIDMSISPDQESLATLEVSGKVQLWDFSGKPKGVPLTLNNYLNVKQVILGPNQDQCIILYNDGKARLWKLSGKEDSLNVDDREKVNSVSISPDGLLIATGAEDGTIKVWNPSVEKREKRKIEEWKAHNNGVMSVKISQDGDYLVTVGKDQTVKLWDKSGNKKAEFKDIKPRMAVFSTEGTKIATGGDNKSVIILNLSGQKIAEFNGNWNKTVSVSFTPDDTQIAAVGDNGTVKIWSIEEELDELLKQGCDWIKDYLDTHQEIKEGCFSQSAKNSLKIKSTNTGIQPTKSQN